MKAAGLGWEPEYQFTPFRKWRLDFAWPYLRVGAEVHGGTWGGGRHTRGAGFETDCEKHNAATLLGWTLLKFTSRMVKDGTAAAQIKQCLNQATDRAR